MEVRSGVVLTPNGVCQVININKYGLSFKCFNERGFPRDWSMDIYDNTGLSLKKIRFRKAWERKSGNLRASAQPKVEVGGEFKNLSSS